MAASPALGMCQLPSRTRTEGSSSLHTKPHSLYRKRIPRAEIFNSSSFCNSKFIPLHMDTSRTGSPSIPPITITHSRTSPCNCHDSAVCTVHVKVRWIYLGTLTDLNTIESQIRQRVVLDMFPTQPPTQLLSNPCGVVQFGPAPLIEPCGIHQAWDCSHGAMTSTMCCCCGGEGGDRTSCTADTFQLVHWLGPAVGRGLWCRS